MTIDVAAIGTSTATGGFVDYNDPTMVKVSGGTYDSAEMAIPGLYIIDDPLIESDETIDLGSPTGSQILVGDANGDGTTQAATQYTIIDDEEPLTAVVAVNATNLTIRDIVPGGKDDRLSLTMVGDLLIITDSNNLLGDFTNNTTGNSVEIPLTAIRHIEIELLEGDDQLSINFDTTPPGFNLSVTIKGGSGHDTLTFAGTTRIAAGEFHTNNELEDIFINGPITLEDGTISLNAVQSLEVNGHISIGTGTVQLTAGRDVFGNCSLIQAGAANVSIVASTGIAGSNFRRRAPSHVISYTPANFGSQSRSRRTLRTRGGLVSRISPATCRFASTASSHSCYRARKGR